MRKRSRNGSRDSKIPPLPDFIVDNFGTDVSRELDQVTQSLSPRYGPQNSHAQEKVLNEVSFALDTSPRAVSMFPFYEGYDTTARTRPKIVLPVVLAPRSTLPCKYFSSVRVCVFSFHTTVFLCSLVSSCL